MAQVPIFGPLAERHFHHVSGSGPTQCPATVANRRRERRLFDRTKFELLLPPLPLAIVQPRTNRTGRNQLLAVWARLHDAEQQRTKTASVAFTTFGPTTHHELLTP